MPLVHLHLHRKESVYTTFRPKSDGHNDSFHTDLTDVTRIDSYRRYSTLHPIFSFSPCKEAGGKIDDRDGDPGSKNDSEVTRNH